MPVGCEFVCKNEKCKNYNTGFSLIGPWAIGNIDAVIEAQTLEANKREMDGLRQKGQTHACIIYPNVNNVKVVGYRVGKWCPVCKIVWNYDILTSEPIEEALKKELPSGCHKCSGKVLSFNEVIDSSVECPVCNEKLQQNRWFVNEGSGETKNEKS